MPPAPRLRTSRTPEDIWYYTKDATNFDGGSCITICGHSKRFARIGGEMASLAQGAAGEALAKLPLLASGKPDYRAFARLYDKG